MKKIEYSFGQCCLDNKRDDYLSLWDYELNNCTPFDINRCSNSKYYFKCEQGLHESFEVVINGLFKQSGVRCRKCNSFGKFIIDNYGENYLNEFWSSKNTYDAFEISKSSQNKVYMKCDKDSTHGEYAVSCANFNKGKRCPICVGKKVVRGINDIGTTHKELIPYFLNENDAYTHSSGSSKKCLFKCLDCGHIKPIVVHSFIKHGFSCPVCDDGISYPNKFMANLLKQMNIKFESEYSPSWVSPKRYDFYLPEYRVIIEMDGKFHFEHNDLSNQTNEELKSIDDFKNDVALKNGIYVIRVDCNYKHNNRTEYIVNSIKNSNLIQILDLKDFDYDMCNENATESKIKKCCSLFVGGKNTFEISDILGVSHATICHYLNRGSEIGWCDFKRTKTILVYKDGIFLNEYNSCEDIIKTFSEKYNVALSSSCVRNVCLGNQKQSKGYVFKYKI